MCVCECGGAALAHTLLPPPLLLMCVLIFFLCAAATAATTTATTVNAANFAVACHQTTFVLGGSCFDRTLHARSLAQSTPPPSSLPSRCCNYRVLSPLPAFLSPCPLSLRYRFLLQRHYSNWIVNWNTRRRPRSISISLSLSFPCICCSCSCKTTKFVRDKK